jgi:hypothetical protein
MIYMIYAKLKTLNSELETDYWLLTTDNYPCAASLTALRRNLPVIQRLVPGSAPLPQRRPCGAKSLDLRLSGPGLPLNGL